ncbi:hypothetical protein [Rhodohalobacter sp. 614A]|uniref:hypothetical protein n=1 Tax=Rhodohalobacter sp. 614A TaxID=2908649 RepID=UPI001F3A0E5A|nr:hypothetical protein [Rhodohalobacter sp. 614A]
MIDCFEVAFALGKQGRRLEIMPKASLRGRVVASAPPRNDEGKVNLSLRVERSNLLLP